MSYAQAIEQQIALMRAMHGAHMQHYAREALDCDESARVYLQHVHDAAETADPYYWSPEMCGVIDGTWREMPDWTLRRETLAGHAGFFWFAQPFGVPCPASEDGSHQDRLGGLIWTVDETLRVPDEPSHPAARERGINDAPEADPDGRACVWLIPVTVEDGRPNTGRSIPWFFGWSRSHVLGQWPDGGPLLAHNTAVGRIFSACLAFMEQRILVSRQESLPRATRKRAEAAFHHEPLVRVVELRRRQAAPAERESSDEVGAWSCRWVVSGHWRQQYFPSTDEHRPIFILPYVKGPDDKPLKPPRAKVFAVVR